MSNRDRKVTSEGAEMLTEENLLVPQRKKRTGAVPGGVDPALNTASPSCLQAINLPLIWANTSIIASGKAKVFALEKSKMRLSGCHGDFLINDDEITAVSVNV